MGLAVAAFSTSPIFIVWADPMPALIKAWVRLVVAAVAVGIAAWVIFRQRSQARLAKEEAAARFSPVVRFTFYGFVTALHFACYVASLDYTTAAHALALVYTAPIFVTLLSAFVLHEPVKTSRWIGVMVAVAGIAILAGLEPQMTPTMLLGDLLAVGAALTFAIYTIAGRYERDRYPLLGYATRVYAAGALWLLPVALLLIPGAPAQSWGAGQMASVLALGAIPLALGHTLYNAALRYLHATVANIIASQEVTGGIILSFLLLGQAPSLNSLVGAVVTLAGIVLVLK